MPEKINKFLDNLISCYRQKRTIHLRTHWRTNRIFLRLYGHKEYDRVRKIDIEYLNLLPKIIERHIRSDELNLEQVKKALFSLIIHRSALNERYLYLAILAAVPALLILIDHKWIQAIGTFIIFSVAIMEKATNIEHIAIYDELITALDNYIEKESN